MLSIIPVLFHFMSLVDRYELLSWIAMQSKVLHQQAQKCHYNSCTTQKFASESVTNH